MPSLKTGSNSGRSRRSCNVTAAKLLPVFLHCSREEALRRVGNPDRVARRKISSGEHLIRELDRYDLTAVPRPDCLKLDTGVNPADVTAQEIVRHFGLDA